MLPKIEELLRGVVQVGTVQPIYERLGAVMNHPLSSATDIGRIMSADPVPEAARTLAPGAPARPRERRAAARDRGRLLRLHSRTAGSGAARALAAARPAAGSGGVAPPAPAREPVSRGGGRRARGRP